MRTMEAVARLAKTTMRRSRGAAVFLAAGAVVLLGLALGRARRAREARRGGRPVPLAEVAAAAVHANPDASRVDLAVAGDLLVPWKAADDLAHLLAELVDNAVAFSAPETRVRVGGRKAGPGYVVEVEDRGLGMTDGELAVVNRRLAGDPAAGHDPEQRLGAWVVGRGDRDRAPARATGRGQPVPAPLRGPGPRGRPAPAHAVPARQPGPRPGRRPAQPPGGPPGRPLARAGQGHADQVPLGAGARPGRRRPRPARRPPALTGASPGLGPVPGSLPPRGRAAMVP